jgi:hypothetical protein
MSLNNQIRKRKEKGGQKETQEDSFIPSHHKNKLQNQNKKRKQPYIKRKYKNPLNPTNQNSLSNTQMVHKSSSSCPIARLLHYLLRQTDAEIRLILQQQGQRTNTYEIQMLQSLLTHPFSLGFLEHIDG